MVKLPKFKDIFGETEITDEMKSKYKFEAKVTKIESTEEIELVEYEGNFTEAEAFDFIDTLKYMDLFVEVDEAGNVKPTAFIKTSKDVLDDVTDGKWSKLSKEEKAAFLRNYIWDGTKFVPTKIGRLKAAVAGAVGSVKNSLVPVELLKNVTSTAISSAIIKSVKNKAVTTKVLQSAIKGVPRGATLGIVLLALAQGAHAGFVTSPKAKVTTNSDNEVDTKTIERDFANNFDATIKTAKSKMKSFIDKLKGKK